MNSDQFHGIWKFVAVLIIIICVAIPILMGTLQFGNKGKNSITNINTKMTQITSEYDK